MRTQIGMTDLSCKPTTKGAFHVTDGLFFNRRDGGKVEIIQTDGKSLEDGGRILFYRLLDSDSWISIVSSVCAGMDSSQSHREAEALHNG